MSFLNPVNEPVLRFSSTDADAPQINYNSRTAGDIKAVLKACLVDGYGTTASAGWSIVNEAGNVAEFVSPSGVMGDYRLGIDDSSASSVTWYYQYQDARVNPTNNIVSKDLGVVDKSSPQNGWQLLSTPRGLIFLEVLYSTVHAGVIARATYMGQVKTAAEMGVAKNLAFWSVGLNAPNLTPSQFFNNDYSSDFAHPAYYDVSGYSSNAIFISQSQYFLGKVPESSGAYDLELVSPVYIANTNRVIGKYPSLQIKAAKDYAGLVGVFDIILNNRPALHVCLGVSTSNNTSPAKYNTAVIVHLDYWGY